MANPFRIDGEWLKAQFHAHSLNSDGEVPPEDVAAAYARHGFDVLTISDHWTMTKVDAPEGLLERVSRVTVTRRPAHTWWGVSAAAIAALALGIGIVSQQASDPSGDIPAFAREAEEGEIWLSDDGLVAGAPALDDLSDEALLELLDELSNVSTGGAA